MMQELDYEIFNKHCNFQSIISITHSFIINDDFAWTFNYHWNNVSIASHSILNKIGANNTITLKNKKYIIIIGKIKNLKFWYG